MGTATVAVAQFAPGPDAAANLATIERLARDAAERGAGLVVFPEYSSYFDAAPDEHWLPHAEALDGPFVTALGAFADELGAVLVAGLVERADDPRKVRNTLVALAPGRGLVASYRKLTSTTPSGGRESTGSRPGAIGAPETFEWGRLHCRAADLLRHPLPRGHATDRRCRGGSRPRPGRVGCAARSRSTTGGRSSRRARSRTRSTSPRRARPRPSASQFAHRRPDGPSRIAALGEAEGVAAAAISPARVAEVRATNPALALRRFGVTDPG